MFRLYKIILSPPQENRSKSCLCLCSVYMLFFLFDWDMKPLFGYMIDYALQHRRLLFPVRQEYFCCKELEH